MVDHEKETHTDAEWTKRRKYKVLTENTENQSRKRHTGGE